MLGVLCTGLSRCCVVTVSCYHDNGDRLIARGRALSWRLEARVTSFSTIDVVLLGYLTRCGLGQVFVFGIFK